VNPAEAVGAALLVLAAIGGAMWALSAGSRAWQRHLDRAWSNDHRRNGPS